MKNFRVVYFAAGVDGLKEIKIKAENASKAIETVLSYMPGIDITIVVIEEVMK